MPGERNVTGLGMSTEFFIRYFAGEHQERQHQPRRGGRQDSQQPDRPLQLPPSRRERVGEDGERGGGRGEPGEGEGGERGEEEDGPESVLQAGVRQ